MKRALIALILFTALAAAPFSDVSFDKAKEQAKKDDKAIFVDFYATWCVPCKELEKTTFADKKVQDFLTNHTVPLHIDAEKETALAEKYKVEAYPTLLFVRPDGSEIGRLVGYEDTQQFLHDAAEILTKK